MKNKAAHRFSPETNRYHTDPILKIIGIDWHLMIAIYF